jgi:PAS domain S-box-containing protein
VPWGTHFCQFYATSQDLVETLVPYFRDGLAANEFCMWITSAPLHTTEAMAALREAAPDLEGYLARGQIEILDYSQWYTRAGRFDADTVLQGWMDKLADARQRGFAGLRLTGNTFWLEQANWDDFTRYEEKVNAVISDQRMIALCTYCLEKCGVREIMDVVANHQFALIKTSGRWEIIESAEHGKIERALRESEERLRLAMWAAELGVFEWDVVTDRAVWENQRMYAIFGQAPQDGALGKAQFITQVIHPDDIAAFEAALAEGMKPGRLFHAICRIRRCNDGELRWIEFSGRFEWDTHGVPLHLSGVLADITERKRVEEALLAYNQQLRSSNQALEDFAFIASHDLREPLRKIQLFGDRLQAIHGLGLGEEGQDYIERMQQAAWRMQGMLDGLLTYARITSQGQPFTPVDLQQVVGEVLSDLEARLVQTGGQV